MRKVSLYVFATVVALFITAPLWAAVGAPLIAKANLPVDTPQAMLVAGLIPFITQGLRKLLGKRMTPTLTAFTPLIIAGAVGIYDHMVVGMALGAAVQTTLASATFGMALRQWYVKGIGSPHTKKKK